MKRIFYSLIVLLGIVGNRLYSQPTTIKTPTNVSINAFNIAEVSPSSLALLEADAANWISTYGSSAVRVGPASATYNCHAYAWHIKDGGSTVWINAHSDYDDDPEELKPYWTGASATYESVIASVATVAFYGSCWAGPYDNPCDHSAKVISPTLFESKWGNWPKYQHAPADCPYVASSITYYKVPLGGSNYVCASGTTLSTLNIAGGGYTWSATNASVSGSGYSVSASTSYINTNGTVEVNIASPFSGTTVLAKRSVILGVPDKNYINEATGWIGSGLHLLEPFDETEIATAYTGLGDILERDVQIYDHSDWDVEYKPAGKVLVNYWHAPTPSSQNMYIRMRNSCGWSLYKETNWEFYTYLLKYTIAPNPVKDNLALLFETMVDPKGLPQHIELMHESSTIPVRSLKVNQSDFEKIKSDKNTLSFNVRDLPRGIYYLRVGYGDKNKPHIHRVILE